MTTSLDIFRSGRHTASSGASLAFTEADLAATAAAYDPALHEAPIVVGHPVTRLADGARFEEWFGPLGKWFEVSAFRTEPGRFGAVFTDISDRKRAARAVRNWCRMAAEVDHRLMRRFIGRLRFFRYGILNHCEHPIGTSPLEGVNNKIKLIKRSAFGYTNFDHLRLHILVECASNPT